jgi:hypothetical protein
MRDFRTVTYHFHGTFTYQEFLELEEEINLCGGTVIYRTLKDNFTFCVIKTEDSSGRLEFEREFKRTAYYRRTKEYIDDKVDSAFFTLINKGNMQWSEENLMVLFNNPESLLIQKTDEFWNLLIVLLNEGLVKIRGEVYPHVPKPEDSSDDIHAYNYCFNQRGETTVNYLRWSGWKWLTSKGETNPIFNHLYVTLFSPTLNMYVKVGEGDPFQILAHLFADRRNNFVQIPFRHIHRLYVFEGTELLYRWFELQPAGENIGISSKVQLALSAYSQHLAKIKENVKQLQEFVVKDEDLPKWVGMIPTQKVKLTASEWFRIEQLRKKTSPESKNEHIQKKKKVIAQKMKEKSSTKISNQKAPKMISQPNWTVDKDQVLITRVFEGLKNGKKFEEIFYSGIKEIGMDAGQCKSRWYGKWSNEYKKEVTKIKAMNSNRQNPNKWDAEKENLLYSAILEGIREGRTIKVITEEVSKQIGISPSACQSYWSSHAPLEYKEAFQKIMLDQEKNWSKEDIQLLNQVIMVEFAHLKPHEAFPFASERLKRHINIIRKKWFELQRMKRI